MNDEDLKKLRELIKEEIRPVKDLVEIIKKKVDTHDLFLHSTSENVRSVKEQQSVMNDKLDSHSASLMTIETEIKAYADMYKVNNSNSKKLEKRIEVIENQSGIIPPPELTLLEVQ